MTNKDKAQREIEDTIKQNHGKPLKPAWKPKAKK